MNKDVYTTRHVHVPCHTAAHVSLVGLSAETVANYLAAEVTPRGISRPRAVLVVVQSTVVQCEGGTGRRTVNSGRLMRVELYVHSLSNQKTVQLS